jgi:hypothetical protein
MPTFRTQPSSSLASSIRNLVASNRGRMGPQGEIAADQAAAKTIRDLSLADKARLEAEQMREADARRRDPAYAQEYAGHVAGIDQPDATRLSAAIRGELEQPGPADYEDNPNVQPYPVGRPNLEPGQERMFRSALAATMANMLATGKTNAAQLAQSGATTNTEGLRTEAAYEPDTGAANRVIAAISGRARMPYAGAGNGTVVNRETGDLDESGGIAQAARAATVARGSSADALTRLRDARTQNVAAGKGATPVAPERIQRMIDLSAQSEYKIERAKWDALSGTVRKATPMPTYAAVREQVARRYSAATKTVPDMRSEIDDAIGAIQNGKNPKLVADRFKQRTGLNLSDVADTEADDGEE